MACLCLVNYDNQSYSSWFPQGLAYVAASARRNGHDVKVVDLALDHKPLKNIPRADFYGIGACGGYWQYKAVKELCATIRASLPYTKIILGGHLSAPDPEAFIRKFNVDYVVSGEGEVSILDILGNSSCPRGTTVLDDQGNIKSFPRADLLKWEEIPRPAYDLFDIKRYRLLRLPNTGPMDFVMPVLSGRGCSFRCNFCYRMDKGIRPRKSTDILDEVEFLQSHYDINVISFDDELLMCSKTRTLEFCDSIIGSSMKFKWLCNGRLNYVDKPVLQRMKEAGCIFINYGIESLDEPTLQVMRKKLTLKQIHEGIGLTRDVGISPGLNFIYGNIDEPIEAIEKAVQFIQHYNDTAQKRTIRPVCAYPGTELFEIAKSRGMVKDAIDFYENYAENSDLVALNFTEYTPEQIHAALAEANIALVDDHLKKSSLMEKARIREFYEKRLPFRGFR